MTTQSLGQAIDSLWGRLPKENPLHKLRPQSLPSPHEHYLNAGEAILAICEAEGVLPYARLPKALDHAAWLRLVAAWSLWNRDVKLNESRAQVAQKLDIDPSNLTNFLNGKRALTSKALLALSEFLGVEPYDIRPEMGARSACSAQRKSMKRLHAVKRGLEDIEEEIRSLQASGFPVENLMKKVGCMVSSLA